MDIEKVYNQVNWDSLFFFLDRMGFGERWRSWMIVCVSTIWFSVLVNGFPAGVFSILRGLRQGKPRAPVLFLLAMDVLSRMLRRLRREVLFVVFKWDSRVEYFTSLFADDTILFCRAST